jgi:hypothetical protein
LLTAGQKAAEALFADKVKEEMEMRVDIDPVPKGLNGRDDPGLMSLPGREFQITGQRPEGRAAE